MTTPPAMRQTPALCVERGDANETNIRLIFDGPQTDAAEMIERMVKDRAQFERDYSRVGWGWSWGLKSGNDYFVRKTKGGISAKFIAPHRSTP